MPARKQTYESPRQLARRASILEATRELLSQRGYEGTTIRDVADQAGVAKGTLYNIYGGKDELIYAAVDDVVGDVIGHTLDLTPQPGIDTILKVNEAICTEITRTPRYVEAISRALFGAAPAKMLVPALIGSPIEQTRTELEVAKDLNQIERDTNSLLLSRQLAMQRWGLIMAFSVSQIGIKDLLPEVTLATARILKSVALGETQSLLDEYICRFGGRVSE